MKNVGRYPDRNASLAHLRLAEDRLAEVSMTDDQIRSIVNGRISDYVTPAQVDAQAAGKLSKSQLSSDVSNYASSSDVGKTSGWGYATLSNGRVPASQMPATSRATRLQANSPYRIINHTTTTKAFNTNETACGGFTAPDPGYTWMPFFIGSFELNIASGEPPAYLKIKDSSNRIVASGLSSYTRGLTRVTLSPLRIPNVYIGSVSFTFYLSFANNTGQVWNTNWENSLVVRQVPWNNY